MSDIKWRKSRSVGRVVIGLYLTQTTRLVPETPAGSVSWAVADMTCRNAGADGTIDDNC